MLQTALAKTARDDIPAEYLITRDGRPFLTVAARPAAAQGLLGHLELVEGESEWLLVPSG